MKILFSIAAMLTAVAGASANDISLQVLAEMNRARTAPAEYAQIVAAEMAGYKGRGGAKVVEEAVRFLQKAKPLPPLTFSEGLTNAALMHVSEQGQRGGSGHGNTFGRMAKFGRWGGMAGENIYYGSRGARNIVVSLIVDDGVRGRKHRANIFNRQFRVVGVAYGSHASFGGMCVTDFAGTFYERNGSRIAGL